MFGRGQLGTLTKLFTNPTQHGAVNVNVTGDSFPKIELARFRSGFASSAPTA